MIIKEHKAGEQSRARVFLNEEEKDLVDRFIKFCRPGFTSCQKANCPVFLRRLGAKETRCCGPICVSQVNKILTKVYQQGNPGEKIDREK